MTNSSAGSLIMWIIMDTPDGGSIAISKEHRIKITIPDSSILSDVLETAARYIAAKEGEQK